MTVCWATANSWGRFWLVQTARRRSYRIGMTSSIPRARSPGGITLWMRTRSDSPCTGQDIFNAPFERGEKHLRLTLHHVADQLGVTTRMYNACAGILFCYYAHCVPPRSGWLKRQVYCGSVHSAPDTVTGQFIHLWILHTLYKCAHTN